jgi:hypothetical protein
MIPLPRGKPTLAQHEARFEQMRNREIDVIAPE